ncbi:MAG: fibronectin type III domain-containing protein, partial [Planctomycetia bacterium]|nr:fibronectin type III domain-containing protein [Planctomycetia bacterium]
MTYGRILDCLGSIRKNRDKIRRNPKTNPLRFEVLEERALLSVTPMEYSDIQADYANFSLPEQEQVGANINEITSDSLISEPLSAAPEGYNSAEIACLQAFLEQTDSSGVKNGAKINDSYSSTDPTTWSGITWTEINGVKRATKIRWWFENLVGSLALSDCTALTSLDCSINKLTSLDVSKNTALTSLDCGRNQLTMLDVSKNTALTTLSCYSNQLTSLDVSKNTALTKLSCGSNDLTSLDVTKNTALTDLSCYSNQLTSLDVSKNTALTDLSCYSNQLASLDVTKNTALDYLSCYSNQLTTLDVSKNTALVMLRCWNSNLESVQLSDSIIGKTWIYLGYGSGATWTFKNNAGTTLETVDSLSYHTISELPVTATNETGTQTITFTTEVAETLSPPTLNSVTATGSDSISVSWNRVLNASGYTIMYATNSSFTSGSQTKTITSGSTTSTTISGLAANTTYYFRVMAIGTESYGDSAYSTTRRATAAKTMFAVPDGYNAMEVARLQEFFEQTNEDGTKYGNLITNRYSPSIPDSWRGITWTEIDGEKCVKSFEWSLMYNFPGGELDLSGFTELRSLYFLSTGLESLNLSGCTSLKSLDLYMHGRFSLNLSGCTSLTHLIAKSISSLDISDISECTALTDLDLSVSKNLTPLDLSKNTALTNLDLSASSLASLDLSKNTALTTLNLSASSLASLDLSKNTALTSLSICENASLTSLDLSGCTKLTNIECNSNPLASLDVSTCVALDWLDCSCNQLKTLDLSQNTLLRGLECASNQLTSLNVSGCTELTGLYCNSNQLTSLDVSKNTALKNLHCYANNFIILDLSGCTALESLGCMDGEFLETVILPQQAIVLGTWGIDEAETWDIQNAASEILCTLTKNSSTISIEERPFYAVKQDRTQTIAFVSSLALTAPTLVVSATSADSVSITVGTVVNASGYSLQYATNSSFTNATTRTVSAGTSTISNLSANTTYYFRVMATGTGSYNNSAYSTTRSATTGKITLAAPSLVASASGSNAVSVTVGTVANASGYSLQYSTSSSFTSTTTTTTTVTAGTRTISGLSANTTYYFRVMATGTGIYGNSDYS